MKMKKKYISTLIFLLLLQVGIDTAKLKTTNGKDDYGLPGFAKDVALVAGIVSGIANNQIGLEKDEMVGELFLGFNQKMSTLEDVDVAQMTTELEKIGYAVSKQCGSGDGCDSVDEKIRSAGIGVFEELKTSIKPELQAILKDENAFKELTTLQDAFNSISTLTKNCKDMIADVKKTDFGDPAKVERFASRNSRDIEELNAAAASFDQIHSHINLLETTKRQEFIAKIDLILELEPLNLSDQDGKIKQLNEKLNDGIALETALSSAFSKVSLVEETIDQITPILSSSIRSPQHPLFFVTSGLDENIKYFEKTFLNGSNADGKNDVQLKTLLNPMRELVNELKPLRTSWNSLKVDGIEQKMDNLRENLKDASSEIAKFSAFSSIRNCVKDATIATSFLFSSLTTVKGRLNAVTPIQQSDIDATKSSYAKVVEHLKKFQEMEGKSDEEIKLLLPNLPPQDQFANDLEAFEKALVDLIDNDNMKMWLSDVTLKTAVSELKMAPVLTAIDCLEKDKLFGFQVNSIQMKPLSSLKSKNPDVKAAISTASALKKVVDEWEKVKTAKANSGNGDEAAKVKLENGMEVARNLVTFSGMITDLAAAYGKKSHFKSLSDSSEDVRKELQEDKPAIRKLLNAWDGSVKKTTRDFPVSLEKVYKLLDKRPSSLWDIEKYLKKMKKFKSINFDLNNVTRQLVRTVRNSNAQKHLKSIGNLNLNFVALQKSLSDAVYKFPYLDEYFLMFADAQSKNLAGETMDPEEAKADESGMSLWTVMIIIGVVCAVVLIVVGFFGWKSYKKWKTSKEEKKKEEQRKKFIPATPPPPQKVKILDEKPPIEKNYDLVAVQYNDKKAPKQIAVAAENNNSTTATVADTTATTGTEDRTFKKIIEDEIDSFEGPCTIYKHFTMYRTYDFSNLSQEYKQTVCTSKVKIEKCKTLYAIGKDYDEYLNKTLLLKGDRGVEVVETVEQHDDRTQSTVITITAEGPTVSERTIGGSEEQLQRQPSQSFVRRVVNYFRELFGMHIEINYVQMEEPPAEPLTEVSVEVEETPAEPHTEVSVKVEETPAELHTEVNVEVEETPAEPHTEINWIVALTSLNEETERIFKWKAAKKLEALNAENERRKAENLPLLSSVSDLETYYSKDEAAGHENGARNQAERVSAGRNENIKATDVPVSPSCPQTFSLESTFRADGTIDAIAAFNVFIQPDYLKIKEFGGEGAPPYPHSIEQVRKLIAAGRLIFQKDPYTLRIKGDLYGTGDLHGKFSDFVLMSFGGEEPWLNKQFVISGDYVDRGERSLCLVLFLVILKIQFPSRVHLLRGNHETRAVNEEYGFKKEIERYYPTQKEEALVLWEQINAMFDEMPVRAIVNNDKMLIVHGGVSKEWLKRDAFDETDGKYNECGENDPKKAQVFEDIFWADCEVDDNDPKCYCEPKFVRSKRNDDARQYNYTGFLRVMKAIKIDYLIRGHQVVPKGFRVMRKHVTVFGASNSRAPGNKSNNNGSWFLCTGNVIQFYRVQNADTAIKEYIETNDVLTERRKLKRRAKRV